VAGNLEKTFNRFLKWFENYESYDIPPDDKNVIRRMNATLASEKEKILEELTEKYSQRDTKFNAIITLGIGDGKDYSYLNEHPIFKSILLRTGKDKYYSKKSQGESLGRMPPVRSANRKKMRYMDSRFHGHFIPSTSQDS